MNGILGMDATWGGATIRCMYWCIPAGNITGGGAAAAIPPPIHIICTRQMHTFHTEYYYFTGYAPLFGGRIGEVSSYLQLELQRLEVLDRLVQHRRLVRLKNSIRRKNSRENEIRSPRT
jgi:hypothetical protein